MSYLENLDGVSLKPNETPGMDCSVVQTRHEGLYLVSTTDFFYPLVEDPYVQGRIACCNVLSDIYAMGVVDVDTMLMILGVSTDMTPNERDVSTTLVIQGFNDCAREANTNVTGGQTVLNPWPISGGVAKALVREDEMIRPIHALPGHKVVLTKPLGTQVAVNLMQWLKSEPAAWDRVKHVITAEQVRESYSTATESMARLNLEGAKLMHAHGARAGTDVTGFGIKGHAENLASSQTAKVDLVIDTLPLIRGTGEVDAALGNMFKLMAGLSAETSGGLMVCVPAENAQAFVDASSTPAWIIGEVVEGTGTARIADTPAIIHV